MNQHDPWRALADLSAGSATPAEIAERALRLMSDPQWPLSLLTPLFRALEDPSFDPSFRARRDASGASLRLYRDASLDLSAILLPPRLGLPEQVVAPGRIVILRVLSGNAALVRWHAGTPADQFTIAGAAPLGKPCETRLSGDDTKLVDGRQDAWRLTTADREAVLLRLTLEAGAATMLREYCARDRTLTRVAALGGRASRDAMLMSLLRELGRIDAVPLFARASEHPAFFARWRAMREWLALDADSAMPRLDAMTERDPHSEVRAAAIAARELLMSPCPA